MITRLFSTVFANLLTPPLLPITGATRPAQGSSTNMASLPRRRAYSVIDLSDLGDSTRPSDARRENRRRNVIRSRPSACEFNDGNRRGAARAYHQETKNIGASTAISTRDAQAGQLTAPVYLRLTA